jgi:hypothetical protein
LNKLTSPLHRGQFHLWRSTSPRRAYFFRVQRKLQGANISAGNLVTFSIETNELWHAVRLMFALIFKRSSATASNTARPVELANQPRVNVMIFKIVSKIFGQKGAGVFIPNPAQL